MRRDEKEITERVEIDAIIRRCQVCRIGLSDDGQPYVVPVCFGYDGSTLYFHCAEEGRKLEVLARNSRVCVEFDIADGVAEADQACGWGMSYRSVIGFGTAGIVEEVDQKMRALELIMAQYSDGTFTFPEAVVDNTAVVRVTIETLTGKQSKRL